MAEGKPSLLRMARAPFLSSILAPVFAGSFLAASIVDSFSIPGFLLALVMGVGLHVATNVYNDIYDTIQGTDKVNVHRNEFSGGSGILLDRPDMMSKMYALARWSLVVSFLAAVGLTLFVSKSLWPLLWGLFILAALSSKFYTAGPVKLAYRGFGEISVCFAFGPMAVLAASVSQDLGFHTDICVLMPATGLSTLSILLIGQLIDLDADRKGGKHGAASRLGTGPTAWIYFFVQMAIVINVFVMFFVFAGKSWPVLLALIPYIFLFPRALIIVLKHHGNPDRLKEAAGINVQTHLLFSALLILGLLIYII